MGIFCWIGYLLIGLILFLVINFLKERYSFTRIEGLIFSIIFTLIIAGFCSRLGFNKFNDNIFLVLVFKFILELIYDIYFLEEDYFNREDSNVKWAVLEIVLMFILNQELINKVDDVFLSGENLKIIVWLFIVGYIYNFYKNNKSIIADVNSTEKSISREKIVVSYAKLKLNYDEDIVVKSDKTRLIIYTIMIFNNYKRPAFLRRIDNIIFKVKGTSRKLGIMQVKSKKFITDLDSINIVIKKILKLEEKYKGKDNYKEILTGYDKENSEKLIYIYDVLKKFCNL